MNKKTVPPLEMNSRLSSDVFINFREKILNQVALVEAYPPLNENIIPNEDQTVKHLAALLKRKINTVIQYAEQNSKLVDYKGLAQSEVYQNFRSLTASLTLFDPLSYQSETEQRTFWINLYNVMVLDAVLSYKIKTSVTQGFLGVMKFFRRISYQINGLRVSLEDIEHGILRNNAGNPFIPGRHFQQNDPRLPWVLPLDKRIHFALNCGSISCPPIQFYEDEKLDHQLNIATLNFLSHNIQLDKNHRRIRLSKIFKWYMKDFGGKSGLLIFIKEILPKSDHRIGLIEAYSDHISFDFQPYNWQLNKIL